MSNEIIIAILVVVLFIALKSSVNHFKGKGGCCGGGSSVKPKRKKLNGPVVCKLAVSVDGMHCENCSNRIERTVNQIDGVSCKVSLRKKEAVISATHEIDETEITELISSLGYEVVNVKRL